MFNGIMTGKNVLVAGGAGFVGSALVRELLDQGANVWSLDDYSIGRRDHLPEHDSLVAIEGDACNLDQVMDLFESTVFHQVYHCIGDTFVPEAYDFPERFFERNVGTTLNILKASRRRPALERLLYVSSTEVYGQIGAEFASESCELAPVNTYAVSKLAADRLCYSYHLEHGVPVIIARIFNCYGPRATHEYIIPEIIRQFALGSVLELGNVAAERDFTYVGDTARGLIALAGSSLADGEVANVGSSRTTSVTELAELLAAIMGVSRFEIRRDAARIRRCDIDRFCADSSKLRTATGWQPLVPLEAGLRRTVDWFQSNGSTWAWMNR